MNIATLFTKISIAGTACVAAVGGLIGGFDKLAHALIFLMVADYILGLIVAIHQKKLNSRTGFKGLLKKIVMLGCVFVAVELNTLMPDIPLRTIVISFYIANEGISVIENISKVAPVPEQMKKFFEQLKDKEGTSK